jgi:APA family basic amino acid/polyamine antiporter
VLPVLAIISCIVLLTQQSGEVWLRGGIIVAVGVVTYVVLRAVRRSKNSRAATPVE